MSGNVINGRPLWEQLDGDNFFFYTSTRHWLVGPDFNSSAGCIHSKDMFLETIPVRGWQFDPERGRDSSATTFSFWTKDPLIRVEGEDKMRNIARGTTDPEIDSVTWIKFSNNMALLALVAYLVTSVKFQQALSRTD